MITQTENAIIERLSEGLGFGQGRMVFEVGSYGGQLDDVGQIVRQLPAVWVEFAGVQSSKPVNTHRNKFWVVSRFNVYVVAYSVRSEESRRKAGPVPDEPGTNRIIHAVRRLLTRQDFGLNIRPLMPGKVRTLFSTPLNGKAISAYSCEFETRWIEEALDPHCWPAPDGEDHPDEIFRVYNGRLDKPAPYHDSSDLRYFVPGSHDAAAEDIVPTEEATVLTVKARDGLRVPSENDPHRYITDTPETVSNSAYYQRRIQEGDLVITGDVKADAPGVQVAETEAIAEAAAEETAAPVENTPAESRKGKK
ncbi:phage protein Gp37 [Enterobacter asburiae]|uniref:phage protein Gp37 n=1 Tax=Enterobacter asburiae TaxID=61645 RepID=UPI003F54B83C